MTEKRILLVMQKLGFHVHWIQLIMCCVSSISYSILARANEVGPIVPSRGLHQGNPLSPNLFLLCKEGFLAILKNQNRMVGFMG